MNTKRVLIVLICVSILAGCSVSRLPVSNGVGLDTQPQIVLPTLLSLESDTDKKSSSVQRASGNLYLDTYKSAKATVNGSELELPSSGAIAEWAIYRLGFFAADPPTAVEINLKTAATIWVAVGDYKLKTWNWSPGKLSGASLYRIELASIKSPLSSKNNLHLAIVAAGESATVSSIKVFTAGAPDWNMYGGNRRHTSQSAFKGPTNPEIIWQTDMDEGYNAPVMDNNGDIYFLSVTSKLYSVNSISGAINWVFSAAGTSFCSPAVDSSRKLVYFGDQTGVFYAVDTETGKEKWRKTHSGQVTTTIVLADDGTILYNQGNGLWAFNPDGSLKWVKDEDGKWKTGAAVGDDGTIYFGNWNDTFAFAVNPDGSPKWTTKTSSELRGVPTVNLDYVYFPGADKNLHILKSSDGSIVNVSSMGSTGFGGAASIALDNNVIVPAYNGDTSGTIFGYKPDGTPAGSGGLPGKSIPPLVIGSDGLFYLPVFGNANAVIAIDPTTQKMKWNLPFTDVNSCLLIGPGNVLYIHVNKSLIAIGEKV